MRSTLFLLLVLSLFIAGSVLASCPQPPIWADGQEVVRFNTAYSLESVLDLIDSQGGSISVPKDNCFAVLKVQGDRLWCQLLGCYDERNGWCQLSGTQYIELRPGEVPKSEVFPGLVRASPRRDMKQLADARNVPLADFKGWSHQEKRRQALPNQAFFATRPDETAYIWNYLGGMRAKIPFPDQISRLPVPDEVKRQFLVLPETTQPERRMVYRLQQPVAPDSTPDFDNSLVFDYGTVWDGAVWFDWKDPVTGALIDSTECDFYYPAIPYADPATKETTYYLLKRYVVCGNASHKELVRRYDVEHLVCQNEAVSADTTEKTEKAPPPSREEAPEYSRDYYRRGVLWMDAINYHYKSNLGGDWGDQESFFAGGIMRFYPRGDQGLGWPLRQLAIVPRVALGYQGMTDSTKADFGGDYSLGLEFKVLNAGGVQVFPQVGYGYTAAQRSWWDWTTRADQSVEWQRHVKFFDSTWWYGMGRLVAPYEIYVEGWIRSGEYLRDRSGYITVEPDWFYSRASDSRMVREKQSRHFDNMTITMPADTMRVTQYRLGVKPWDGWVFYALHESQNYQSPVWGSISRGWGGGVEWRITESWRLKGDTKRFGFHENTNKALGVTDEGRKWEFRIGADYRF